MMYQERITLGACLKVRCKLCSVQCIAVGNCTIYSVHYRDVATSLIPRHKKLCHDCTVVLHLKSGGAAEKSLHGCLRRVINVGADCTVIQPTLNQDEGQ